MLYDSDLLVVSRNVQKLFILLLGTLPDEMGKSRSRQVHRISFFVGHMLIEKNKSA